MQWSMLFGVLVLMLAGCTQVEQGGCSATSTTLSCSAQMAGKNGSETYDLTSAGRASIQWSGQSASGSLTIELMDSSGSSIFSRTVSGSSQGAWQASATGIPGSWQVRLSFTGFTGQMGFNIQT